MRTRLIRPVRRKRLRFVAARHLPTQLRPSTVLSERASDAIIAITVALDSTRRSVVANLTVRNVDEDIVQALKAWVGRHGTSAEAEHRRILAQALLRPRRRTFAEVLARMPGVGEDTDFERIDASFRDHVPR